MCWTGSGREFCLCVRGGHGPQAGVLKAERYRRRTKCWTARPLPAEWSAPANAGSARSACTSREACASTDHTFRPFSPLGLTRSTA